MAAAHSISPVTNALCGVQTPSAKDIQNKLGKPLGTLGLAKELANKPKELANSAKVNTPNAENLASKVLLLCTPLPIVVLVQVFTNCPALSCLYC